MKIKVTSKNKEDKKAELLLQKEMNFWVKQNDEMLEEFNELAQNVIIFNIKWGHNFTLKNPKGRKFKI